MSYLRSKLQTHVEHEEGTWAISYGDMITLLLCFFVLYFSFDFKSNGESEIHKSLLSNLASVESVSGEVYQTLGMELVTLSAGQVLVFFKDKSFFDSGKTDLRPDVGTLLSEFAEKFRPFSATHKLKIYSFTDSKPVSPGRRYRDNLELSALRSLSVVRLLNERGIPLGVMEITGKGEMGQEMINKLGIEKLDTSEKMARSRTVAFLISRGSI